MVVCSCGKVRFVPRSTNDRRFHNCQVNAHDLATENGSKFLVVPHNQKNSVVDLTSSPITIGGGKDPSPSTKSGAETVRELPIDAAKIKGHISTDADTPLPRRTTAKKAGASSSSPLSKPLWKTILSVFAKNFVLLLVLVLLALMIRRLALYQWDENDALILSSDYEARIAEMDAYLKTTTKTMQFRIDAIDQKIQNEIIKSKTELTKRIDDGANECSIQLQELSRRVDTMEKSLSFSPEWLSKDEFHTFTEELKNPKPFDNFADLKLDEVRALAREIVEKEIGKHAADGIGRVDYAAASGGAKVVDHSDPFPGKANWFNRNKVSSDAVKMLQPSFGEPGRCFALKGNIGFVEIELRTSIVPEAITLEHVAESVAFDRSSAPKECKVFGWLANKGQGQSHLLAEFVYDLEKNSVQTFNVLEIGGSINMDTIRLEVMSNHGNPTHTCVYRLRVHGHEPDSLSSIAL